MVKLDWLQDLLKETFLEKCKIHGQGVNKSRKDKVTFYCFDCKLCLCSDCILGDSTHKFHNHIKIHTYKSQSGVSTVDVQRLNLIGTSDIKDYIYNGIKLLLLHQIQESSRSVKYTRKCENCHVLLREQEYDYCSLSCKAVKIHKLDTLPKTETGSSVQRGSNPNEPINLI